MNSAEASELLKTYGVFRTPDNIRQIVNRIGMSVSKIYQIKNHDYGNSFDQSLDKHGMIDAIVRMEDKLNRLDSLKDKDAKVVGESLYDTAVDLANYAVMLAMWIEEHKMK